MLRTHARTGSTTLLVIAGLVLSAHDTRGQQPGGVGSTPSECAKVAGPDDTTATRTASDVRVPASTADTGRAALRLLASVTADEVRFVGSPKICVTMNGAARLDSVRVTARRNITSPIVSGTTYRSVYVAVEIVGRLNAECIAGRITDTPAEQTHRAGGSPCAQFEARSSDGAGVRSP